MSLVMKLHTSQQCCLWASVRTAGMKMEHFLDNFRSFLRILWMLVVANPVWAAIYLMEMLVLCHKILNFANTPRGVASLLPGSFWFVHN